MRIAALYDIHGNLPALEAVLQEIEQLNVNQIVVGGDVVLGPMSRECLDKLADIQIPVSFIRGNCEMSVLAQMNNQPVGNLPDNILEDLRWTANQLLARHHALLSKLPRTVTLKIDGLGDILFCHATPSSETENFTRLTPEKKLNTIFKTVEEPYVVCGHTHMQFDISVGKVRIINAGSVGMPFGKPGAYWLLLGEKIELGHTTYNLTEAAERILKTDYPHAKDFAENNVLHPPSEETMLEMFNRTT